MKPILNTFLALIILLLSACKDKTDKLAQQSNPAVKTEKQKQSVNISFSSARPVDTTEYVIYPVYTSNEDEADSYKRDGIPTYRNLVFYNAATGAYHLLGKRKMLITSFTSKYADAFSSDPELIVRTSHLIFYTVKVEDYNGDGKLGSGDPEYLFISDKQGSFFKQISPDKLHILNYKEVKGNKVMLELKEDTNNDKKFNGDDRNLAYVYDIKDGKIARPVFSASFTDSVLNLLYEQWEKEK